MKQIFLMLAIVASAISINAQDKNVPSNNSSKGDLYSGLTRPLTFNRMIPPYALEVTFSKTVHVIFPSAIRYVDLGSADLLAAKADGTENVLRVKAAAKGFKQETNISVITEDGSYYVFNVKYADEPVKLSVEMTDFLHPDNTENRPGNELPVYMSDLGSESPFLVKLIEETVYKNNQTKIRHIGSQSFGIEYLLKGIYSYNDLLFFHLQMKNKSNVSFNTDYITFKVVDKKVAKRTAIQEQVVTPLRSYNQVTAVAGSHEERTVFVLPKFTLPNDKQFVIEITEKDGGRNQKLMVENTDLVRAEAINNLKVSVK